MSFEIKDGVLRRYNPEKGEKKIVIPDGVTKIGAQRFQNSLITDVMIPEGVTEIAESAFDLCVADGIGTFIRFKKNRKSCI